MFGLGIGEFLRAASSIALLAIIIGLGLGMVSVLFNAIAGKTGENKQ